MDPLGARPSEIDLVSVRRWADTTPPPPPLGPPPGSEAEKALPNSHVVSPFSVREDLNAKVALWYVCHEAGLLVNFMFLDNKSEWCSAAALR